MKDKNKTYQKTISAIMVVLILLPNILFFLPNKTNAAPVPAVPVIDPANLKANTVTAKSSFLHKILGATTAGKTTISSATDLKQWAKKVLEEALRNLAKRFLQKMTESTVNWINSGFHGAPLFLERPESFFKDIAKYEIKNLVGAIGHDSTSFPFGKSFLINAINNYKSTFEQNAQYSLSRVVNDPTLLQNMREDFGTGGWDAFFVNNAFDQNNRLGSEIMYADYLGKKLLETEPTATDDIKNAIAQGQGFLSPQKCETNPNFNKFRNQFQQPSFKCSIPEPRPGRCPPNEPPPWRNNDAQLCGFLNRADIFQWERACDAEKEAWSRTNACPDRPNGTSGFVRTTPGSVVADQIMNSLTSGKRQGELAIAMGNSLSAIFDALINQLFQKGLNALSSQKNPPPPPVDDFNYYGNTLGPANTTGPTDGFKWVPERDYDLETGIQPHKTDGKEYIDWVDPSNDPNIINQFNNDTNPTTCPAGHTGTPPTCVIDETYLGPPISVCPQGQTGTPPNCEVELGPPDQAPITN